MNLPAHIAKHLREIHFGGNWTYSNLKDTLEGVTWEQATRELDGFNSIAVLVFHINYYVHNVSKVLEGARLDSKDEYSFLLPPIASADDWNDMLDKVWQDAENFALLIEQLPEDRMWEDFTDAKYGIYYRNLHGIIEHMHYHLGQIVFLKKMIGNK